MIGPLIHEYLFYRIIFNNFILYQLLTIVTKNNILK